jgi:Cu-Zn family superoxide dismutase
MRVAVAIFSDRIDGRLTFECIESDVTVKGVLTSKNLKGCFGCHIHKFGDPEIDMLGGHYDKNGAEHPYHTGDLPNVHFHKGKCIVDATLYNVTLEQLYGRSIVVHKNCDDMGSVKNGHSGKIRDFAVIVRSDQ